MASIGLSSGFSLIPEGEHIFKIVGCEYKVKFGKIEVKLETKNGQKHTERYAVNTDGGLNAFSYFAKTALNNFELTEIDHEDIIGKFIKATVEHTTQPHRDDPKKTVTFVNLGDKTPVDGWDDEDTSSTSTETAPPKSTTKAKVKPDLSFLDN